MKWQRVFLGSLSVLILAVVLAGCARRTVTVRETRPVYVTPPPGPPVTVVQVQQAPPEAITENRPPAPGGGYIWMEGYWTWTGTGWAWTSGRWVRPPRPKSEWVPGHWERAGGTWMYHQGYWR
jgi:hypothetical protein